MTLRLPPPRLDRKLHRIAELADVGVLLLSAQREIDFASRRAEVILGLSLQDKAGWDDFIERVVGAARGAWAEQIDGRIVELDWMHGGVARRLTVQVYFLDEEDCEGQLLLIRDRSLQRALETDLAAAAQMRNLSRLYMGLGHDLRSPLNTIVLNLELLKLSLSNGEDTEVTRQRGRWLEILEQETRRLSDSLDTLLDQTLEPAAERGRFDLDEVVLGLANLLRGQSRQQEVTVEVAACPEPLVVFGRRDHIQRALLNVAVNGLEATPAGGRLSLSMRRDGGRAVVEIVDTGPGIPADAVDRIFEIHFSTKESGTGLGLYVARSALEAEGGELLLTMNSPRGATFAVHLPTAPEED